MTTTANSTTTADKPARAKTSCKVEACRDDDQLRHYLDEYWRKDHVLARDARMFDFTYRTPWVDRERFPNGTSVLCIYDEQGEFGESGGLLGFLGTIAAPYPRPRSCWLALWHVLPSLKGTGLGGQLLQEMQSFAEADNGWIGTFGAGPEAVPVYLKRGYSVRAVRRWVYSDELAAEEKGLGIAEPSLHSEERLPNDEWLAHRFDQHPIFDYDRSSTLISRTEENEWGVVTHCCRLSGDWRSDVARVYDESRRRAASADKPCLMDAWGFNKPGPGWRLAAEDLPSVFHPPVARGNLIYASARDFMPTSVGKGDCDQDRPN